ncbi:hypothetical protein [Shewanella baltica]|uniref:hypothetical protein n=1 Tax=Shewanella baltica TaxID=62322 RepID=UPI003CFFA307
MRKIPLFLGIVVMLNAIVSTSFNAVAEKFNTLYFQGEVAEPSCYFDLSAVSCFDPLTRQFSTQDIQTKILTKSMLSGDILTVPTKFKQINVLLVKQLEGNELLVSLNYN